MKFKPNLKEQNLKVAGDKTTYYVAISKDKSNVPLVEFQSTLEKALEGIPIEDRLNYTLLFSLLSTPKEFDSEVKAHRERAYSFVLGILVGKFLARTCSKVESLVVVPDENT